MPTRRLSGPVLAPISSSLVEVRPRANSEPVTMYGAIALSVQHARLPCVQERPIFDVGLGEKQSLAPLMESPFASFCSDSTILEEKNQLKAMEESIVTDKGELELLSRCHELPPQLCTETSRRLWSFCSMYRLIFAFILLANFTAALTASPLLAITSSDAATAAAINLCVAIAFRNEHVINAIFRIACHFKPSAPLAVRRLAGKVYCYGGFHSGCATVGTLWYIAFTILLGFQTDDSLQWPVLISAILISLLLLCITWFALPAFRIAHHNTFEIVHRFGGWIAVALLWAQLVSSVTAKSFSTHETIGMLLLQEPLFWCVVIITLAIIYPWSRLRLRDVHVQVLSPRAALLHFDYKRMKTCLGIRITDSPLKETHSFATISRFDNEHGFRVLMSRAGDWTANFIDNPPSRIWVKGAPVQGVMRVALMFRKVLVIATGTGIGPCLSLLESFPEHPMHVLWMGSNPRASYGDTIINSVYNADPGACIVDTSKAGRGDILELAYARFVESQSEAVVIISNAQVTRRVVEGLETRGIPVFGAIFDS